MLLITVYFNVTTFPGINRPKILHYRIREKKTSNGYEEFADENGRIMKVWKRFMLSPKILIPP
jgi:hypothetical protein